MSGDDELIDSKLFPILAVVIFCVATMFAFNVHDDPSFRDKLPEGVVPV